MAAFRTLGCAVLLLALTVPTLGQTAVQLQSRSEFWIEGRSSVNTFTCRVDTVHGRGRLADVSSVSSRDATAAAIDGAATEPRATIQASVRTFDCGKPQMTQDLKETLNAGEHPIIQFRLQKVEDVSRPDTSGGWYRLKALGFLTISGTERLVRVSAWGRPLSDSIYRVHGCKAIDMTYFGIEPPTKFFGLVKVHDRVEVHFDLLAETNPNSDSTPATLALTNPPTCYE
jgi:hypothetical protein